MNILGKIFEESVLLALAELRNNKLRTFLSLLGITIGILCIISVYTAVDSLENNLRSSVNQLGEDVVYIQKWPWSFGESDYAWWKYFKRPVANLDELQRVQDKVMGADASALLLAVEGRSATYLDRRVEGMSILGITHDYSEIRDLNFYEGRYFTQNEIFTGRQVAILGYNVANELFNLDRDNIGKTIKVMDRELLVIGILTKEGEDMLGMSLDNDVIVPYQFLRGLVRIHNFGPEPMIMVKAADGISLDALKDELRGVMRGVRKLPPKAEDDFALNQLSILSQGLSTMFRAVNIAGTFIGLFAILVGGFGIANIMFVSVKERTKVIGVKKALGARRMFIMLEFLTESVILCILGGLVGMFLVFLMTIFANVFLDFTFKLTWENVGWGMLFSVVIGVISGVIPAWIASRMRPVDAMRSV